MSTRVIVCLILGRLSVRCAQYIICSHPQCDLQGISDASWAVAKPELLQDIQPIAAMVPEGLDIAG
jgi:hypothetical protein